MKRASFQAKVIGVEQTVCGIYTKFLPLHASNVFQTFGLYVGGFELGEVVDFSLSTATAEELASEQSRQAASVKFDA